MSLKKKINQDALRKMMTEHQKKLSVKKIESPLAKYTDSGQLMCILCKSLVKNESVWVVHLNSKSHKENVVLAKRTKLESIQTSNTIPTVPSKRLLLVSQELQQKKKFKNIENEGESQLHGPKTLPPDFFDNTSISNSNTSSLKIKKPDVHEKDESVVKEEEETKKEIDSSLPEGFFDDPILDAKVRNVEYKDPMEEEWDKFQKEIKEETAQSAQIIAEDQEEATTERQLEEIEEQIRNWSRVMDLVKLKESVHRDEIKEDTQLQDSSSTEETDYDEDMDWRAKKSKK